MSGKSGVAKTKNNQFVSWRHPGGKLRRLGSEHLTDSELLAILIGAGSPHKSAQKIADDILKKFQSFRGIANQPMEKLTKIEGLKDVKATRIAAAFEIAKRVVSEVKEDEKY